MISTCPRCGQRYGGFPALSRRANVDICRNCGQDEAIRDYLGYPPMKFEDWYADPRAVA